MTKHALALLLVAACGDPTVTGGNPDGGGTGDGAVTDSTGSNIDAQRCGSLTATIRDFKIDHPDFEVVPAVDAVIEGIVLPTITPGGKPRLSPMAPPAGLVTSATTFDQWYRDVAGINQTFARDLPLAETSPGIFVYDNAAFFPIDGEGFGNEGNPHNYHFTSEIHASFQYEGGEQFTFRGDDDVWVFVNGTLVIDIGGVHSAAERTVDFDAIAAQIGIAVGGTYALDIFQAERHVTGSNYRIETSIDCFIIL
jgi:fibro-slime domain-containing protein